MNENIRSGESGQQGHDRQPGKEASASNQRTPGAGEAASSAEVKERSTSAADNMKASPQGQEEGRDRRDMVHPGPGREEAEKSKGDAHHDQREPQPDMQKEIEEL